jgi:hypothetical protein
MLRCTNASLIYRRTNGLGVVQLLFGRRRFEIAASESTHLVESSLTPAGQRASIATAFRSVGPVSLRRIKWQGMNRIKLMV